MHLLSIEDLSRSDLESLFEVSDQIKGNMSSKTMGRPLIGQILATLFLQPSTRTRFSFESAMHRLGGAVLSFSSEGTRAGASWGEALCDTARVMNGYADVIVLRHPDVEALREYASHSRIPVINGGNGMGSGAEHPTQAVLDLYTIRAAFGRIDGLRILMVGNMQLRGARSLCKALAKYDSVEIYVLCPANSWLDEQMLAFCDARGLSLERVNRLSEVICQVDVVYHHGLSEERDCSMPDEIRLTQSKLARLRDNALLLHALPRAGELPFDIDALPQAKYFSQSNNGVYTRMAVLLQVLNEELSSGRA